MANLAKITLLVFILMTSMMGHLDFEIDPVGDRDENTYSNSSYQTYDGKRITSIETRVSYGEPRNGISLAQHGTTGFSANIESETVSSSENFEFNFNETASNNQVFLDNQSQFSVNPISSISKYDQINFDIDAFTNKTEYNQGIDDGGISTNSEDLLGQGLFIPEIDGATTNSSLKIDSLSVPVSDFTASGTTIEAALFTARQNLSLNAVFPDNFIGAVNTTYVDGSEIAKFNFGQNLTVSQKNTYSNSSGMMVFVILRSFDNAWIPITDTSDNFETYLETSGQIPQNDEDWAPENYDVVVNYNASFVFDPSEINTTLSYDSTVYDVTDPNNFAIQDIRTSTTNYQVAYNSTLELEVGVLINFNLTYTYFGVENVPTTQTYISDPQNAKINWTIIGDLSLSTSISTVHYILLPKDFIDIVVYKDDVLLSQGASNNYTLNSNYNAVNQSIDFDEALSTGTYRITANSTNLFDPLTLSTFVDPGSGYTAGHTAYMGTLNPEVVGDTIRANVSTSSLDISTGIINSTLRTPDGSIINSGLTFGDHNNEEIWANVLEFTTQIDPDLETGVWSVQFRWSNGTAAAAIAVEFLILPQTTLQFTTPTADFNALEGSSVLIEVGVINNSTDSQWTSDGSLDWTFGTQILSYTRFESGIGLHIYTTSLNLDILANAVETSTNYTLTATFTEGPLEIFTEITMTTYHVGTGQVDPIGVVEYGNDFSFTFRPINVTDDNSTFDSSNATTFDISYTNSSQTISFTTYNYSYSSPDYTFNIPWNSSFVRGASNEFTITWNLPELREDANVPEIVTTVAFDVDDSTGPSFTTTPDDATINEVVSDGYSVTWIAEDPFPDTYSISINSQPPVVSGQSWNSGEAITYTFTGEQPTGVYNLEVTVVDEDGNSNSDTVTITVIDERAPTLSDSPQDQSIAIANDTSTLSWTFTDNYPDKYWLEINTEDTNVEGVWLSGQPIDIDISGLADGDYDLTLNVNDTSNNIESNIVSISIDRTAPTLDEIVPDDGSLEYNLDSTSNTVTVFIEDNNGNGNWTTYLDGAIYNATTIFTGSGNININVDGLAVGTYNLTIVVYDSFGNIAVSEIDILVQDATNPTIQETADFEFELGTGTTQQVSWIPQDNLPSTYTIYENGTIIDSGNWNDNEAITIDVTNNLVGLYNYTIVVSDQGGNSAISEVFVTVVDTIAPTITSFPDTRIFDNQTGYQLSWNAVDLNASTYEIFRNGTQVDAGLWVSGVNVTYTLVDFDIGVYLFEIVVSDGSGNSISDSVVITIKSADIVETAGIDLTITSTVREGDTETISGTWTRLLTDQGVANAQITVTLRSVTVVGVPPNTEVLSFIVQTNSDGSFSITLDYSSLNAGAYEWLFLFTKDGFESTSTTDDVQIVPHSVNMDIQFPDNLVQGESFTIIVVATYDNDNLQLMQVNSRSGGVANTSITMTIQYIGIDGNPTSLTRESLTNANGRAEFVLNGETTNNIREITSMTAAILDLLYFDQEATGVATAQLPSIQVGDPGIGDFAEDAQVFVQENWQFIVLAIIGLLGIFIIFNNQRKKRRRRRAIVTQEIETASEEVEALISIQAIILKNSESGIPFFNATFEEEDDSIDLSLISSLTTAISTFLSELHSSAKGFESMEREGISLVSHRGEISDFIIITKKPLPMMMYQQISDSHAEIENAFSTKIDNPAMIYEVREEDIFEIMRENNFKMDLKGYIKIDIKQIDKVKGKSSISRNIRSNLIYLKEYNDMISQANLPITLPSLIDFLGTKEINQDTASRLILVAYSYEILVNDRERMFN